MDFFIDRLYKDVINSHIKTHSKLDSEKLKARDFLIWKAKTRNMFSNYPFNIMIRALSDAFIEATNEDWFKNKYPNGCEISLKKESHKYPRSKYDILAIADKYGLEIKRNKCCCPFHSEKEPSLQFYPKTNSFFCFGCRQGGDAVRFVQMMEELHG